MRSPVEAALDDTSPPRQLSALALVVKCVVSSHMIMLLVLEIEMRIVESR